VADRIEGADVVLGDHLHDGLADDTKPVEGVGRDDHQVARAAGASLVTDADDEVAAAM